MNRSLLLASWLGLGLAAPAVAAPITSNTALPVAEDELLVRGQFQYLESTGDPGPLDQELRVRAYPTVFVYGASEKLTLFGLVPFLDEELERDGPGGRVARGDAGLADMRFLARYTLGQWDRWGETVRLGAFAGLELPTGADDGRDALGRLPAPLQLGSGSWDPNVGAVLSWSTLDWALHASTSWKFNTEAGDFEFGDRARLSASYQYRLWPRELGEKSVPAYLNAVIESNLVWRGRHEMAGRPVAASGGTTWYVAPGLQYVTRDWIVEAAVQLPVAQDLNGAALENDFIVTAGVRFWF